MTQSRPPTSVRRQAWGERPYLHDLLGFQPHDSLETQGFLSAERLSAQAAVRTVCSPKHRRGQAGTSWGAGHILPRTGCAARGRRSLGRGSHNSHRGPDCSSGLGGPPPRDRRQARGTHPPQDGTPSLWGLLRGLTAWKGAKPVPKTISISWGLGLVEPRLTLVEASTLVGRGSRPQGQGTRSTTSTFTFSFPVFFFFFLET